MPLYEVTRYWHTNEVVTVEAENEEEAIKKAENCNIDVAQIINGLQEDSSPDVTEVVTLKVY